MFRYLFNTLFFKIGTIRKKTILLIVFFFCYVCINYGFKQNDNPWEKWDSQTIDRANTAEGVDYLPGEEKQVILLTNLARFNGPLFAETFLQTYMEDKKSNKYTLSLSKDLKKVKKLQALYPEKDLYEVAMNHAAASGKTGRTGHQNFDKRFKPLLGKYNLVAENCAYGFNRAIDIVIELLIDEDVPDLGHRKNILNSQFNSTGVSIQPHINYDYNCVITYGRKVL